MKKITIKKLRAENFKGLKSIEIIPSESVTNIYGENATGKTTIADAFTWCLFGKNSSEESDFEIKTLGKDNNPIHKLEHTVELVLSDGSLSDWTFRRTYKEEWTKPRGQAEEVFSGHTTYYWVNEVPCSQKEYKEKVESIIPENIFKILTNPSYFNKTLKWQDRRTILFNLTSGISDAEIAANNPEFVKLLSLLTGKTLAEYKKEVSSKRTKLNDELKFIPAKVEELQKQKPEPIDTAEVNDQIQALQEKLALIDSDMTDKMKVQNDANKANIEAQKKIGELELEIQKEITAKNFNITNNVQTTLNAIETVKNSMQLIKGKISNIDSQLQQQKLSFDGKNAEILRLRNEYKTENEKAIAFDSVLLICPTCNRDFEANDIDAKKLEMTTSFNTNKVEKLNTINTKGIVLKNEVAKIEAEIKVLKDQKATLETEHKTEDDKIPSLNMDLETLRAIPLDASDNEKTLELKKQIEKLKQSQSVVVPFDNTELLQSKTTIQTQINEYNKKLGTVDVIKSITLRIEELIVQQKRLSQEIADLEKQEFVITEFTRKKVETVEGVINSMFSFVQFKMYEQLVNGNMDETCICLVDGVGYSDLNSASKINAGLDIINVLSKHYSVSLPVILDNRESVVNIIPFAGQVINLIVSEGDKVLRFENK